MANKVKYGLKNVYYSVITIGTDSKEVYATPVAIPGAVSLSLDAQGDETKFYADDSIYWRAYSNQGYEGSLEMAIIPDAFKTACLGYRTDNNGVLVESKSDNAASFALLFQFDGDDAATKHVLYSCKAQRPSVTGSTSAESLEAQTESVTVSAVPSVDGYVKASCNSTATTAYTAWFTSVQKPGTFPA